MTARTLRRKNQKKAKRRRYARCSKCGGFALTHLKPGAGVPMKRCRECKFEVLMRVTYGRVAER